MDILLNKDQRILDFEDIIHPIEPAVFEKKYWEQQPILIERKNPDYFKSLLSIEKIDEILDCNRPTGTSLRVVKNQEPLSTKKYENPDGSLNLNQLYAAYADGYTLVINEIERYWGPIRVLCQNLQNTLNHKAVANMYLTPKNQKALKPHYDTHDVYIIQIHGEKHWKLYDADYSTPILHSHQPVFQREQLRNERNITVKAGDVLYVPRGVPHEVITRDKSSIHLTIGVYPTQWMDVLSKAIGYMAHTNITLRQSLPLGFLSNQGSNKNLENDLQDKLETLLETINRDASLEGALQLLAEEFRNQQKPMGDGHFSHLDNIDEIHGNMQLELRDGITPKVQNLGEFSRIIFSGNVIKGPRHISPCFDFIANAKKGFCVGDIPLINDTNKIKLVKRLVRGGLLKIQE